MDRTDDLHLPNGSKPNAGAHVFTRFEDWLISRANVPTHDMYVNRYLPMHEPKYLTKSKNR